MYTDKTENEQTFLKSIYVPLFSAPQRPQIGNPADFVRMAQPTQYAAAGRLHIVRQLVSHYTSRVVLVAVT